MATDQWTVIKKIKNLKLIGSFAVLNFIQRKWKNYESSKINDNFTVFVIVSDVVRYTWRI